MKSRNEIKNGLILSYLLIFINMVYGLLITPYLLKYVGNVDYGVYKSVSSLSASLAVLDLGLGSTMTRYMSKYNAEKDYKTANNFSAMMFIQYFIIAGIIAVVGVCVQLSLESIFGAKFSESELLLAKGLLIFLILNTVLRLFENLLTGIAGGFEHFTVSNGVKIGSIVLKVALLFVFLPYTRNVMLVVILETVVVIAACVVLIIYILKVIGIRPKLIKWDNKLFRESFGYTGLMFVQTLTIQFNGNIDNILIGASLGVVSVTIYSVSLQLFGIYEHLSGSVANIMLPNIAKRIAKGESSDKLQQGVEKAGRLQFAILAAALGGFIVLGKDFFYLWLGKDFGDCYYITLMLIVPVTFTMMQNVALSVLRAQNRMLYRTVTLAISCMINFGVSIVCLKYLGYWGAAIGTVVSTVSNLIFMNIYYKIKLGFKIIPMFIHIMGKTLPCAAIAGALTFLLHTVFGGSWISFIVNAIVFMLIYITLLMVWGLKKEEKEMLLGRFALKRSKK